MIQDPNKNSIDNIREAIQLLKDLAKFCPNINELPTFAMELKKLDRLTSDEQGIKNKFQVGDSEELGDSQAETERILGFLGPSYMALRDDIVVSNRKLDRNNCDDMRLLLRLAIVLWHEAHHWNDWVDGPLQDVELEMMEKLIECLENSDFPCASNLVSYLRSEAIPDNKDQKKKEGTGFWNWMKKWVFARGSVILILVLIILALTIGTGGTIWIFLLKGLIIAGFIILYLWLRSILCPPFTIWKKIVTEKLVWLWKLVERHFEWWEEKVDRIEYWEERQVSRQRRVRRDRCTTWPYGTQWMCKLGSYIWVIIVEIVTIFVKVVNTVVKYILVVIHILIMIPVSIVMIVVAWVPKIIFLC